MKKLVNGIVEFRQKILPGYREKFAALALGQRPDVLFIACSDSRVVPNLFASTDPGDLFVVRNVGNLIPSCGLDGHSSADESEAAAIEFAVMNLNVADIIVCGHSDCGAMHALVEGRNKVTSPNLRAWLRHGEPALGRLANQFPESTSERLRSKKPALSSRSSEELSARRQRVNRLSKVNVLQQLEHLTSYPLVRDRIAAHQLKLHGWWFELSTADVYAYEKAVENFVLIDEQEAQRILARLS